mmetsp:Transcript_21019/g.64907  ORF Transcript_21019/g.64907 Transcript_21019/m.64907 type:complete len:295 (+) Transcript_21019:488-1372(+)
MEQGRGAFVNVGITRVTRSSADGEVGGRGVGGLGAPRQPEGEEAAKAQEHLQGEEAVGEARRVVRGESLQQVGDGPCLEEHGAQRVVPRHETHHRRRAPAKLRVPREDQFEDAPLLLRRRRAPRRLILFHGRQGLGVSLDGLRDVVALEALECLFVGVALLFEFRPVRRPPSPLSRDRILLRQSVVVDDDQRRAIPRHDGFQALARLATTASTISQLQQPFAPSRLLEPRPKHAPRLLQRASRHQRRQHGAHVLRFRAERIHQRIRRRRAPRTAVDVLPRPIEDHRRRSCLLPH